MPERFINHSQIKKSHCNLSSFFKAQDLPMIFHLCGIEVYEDPICIFYANIYLSQDSGESKTLVFGIRLILNDFLFEKVFDAKLSGVIPHKNGSWLIILRLASRKLKRLFVILKLVYPILVLCLSTLSTRFYLILSPLP